jgi:hypothetical protein
MNSVHFCSIKLRSNQMHYFYYLKLKTIYNISLWYTTGANGEKSTEQQLHNIPNRRPTKQEILV